MPLNVFGRMEWVVTGIRREGREEERRKEGRKGRKSQTLDRLHWSFCNILKNL